MPSEEKKKNSSPCRFQLNHCHSGDKIQTHRLTTINAVLIETETYAHAQRYIHARKRNLYIHSRPPATTHTRTYIYTRSEITSFPPFSVLRFHFRLSLSRVFHSFFVPISQRQNIVHVSYSHLCYFTPLLASLWHEFSIWREREKKYTRRATKRNKQKEKERKMKRKSLLSTLIVGLQNKHLIDIFCVCLCVCVCVFFFFFRLSNPVFIQNNGRLFKDF